MSLPVRQTLQKAESATCDTKFRLLCGQCLAECKEYDECLALLGDDDVNQILPDDSPAPPSGPSCLPMTISYFAHCMPPCAPGVAASHDSCYMRYMRQAFARARAHAIHAANVRCYGTASQLLHLPREILLACRMCCMTSVLAPRHKCLRACMRACKRRRGP